MAVATQARLLYVLLYLLSLIHGLARITSPPKFWMFFMVPGIVYALDKVVSLRGSYMELDILETELLPSDVLRIRFYRPPNMKVLSGQWIRFTCTSLAPEVTDKLMAYSLLRQALNLTRLFPKKSTLNFSQKVKNKMGKSSLELSI